MTSHEQSNSTPSGPNVSDVADAMLDVMLTEVLTGKTPPDQSEIIVRRLQKPAVCIVSTRSRKSNSRSSRNRKVSAGRSASTWKLALVTAATLLVCAGVAVGIRYQSGAIIASKVGDLQDVHGGNNATADRAEQPAPRLQNRSKAGSPEQVDRGPPSPIALADTSSDANDATPDAASMFGEEKSQPLIELTQSKPTREPLTFVSTSLSNHVSQYWERIGVEPTNLLPPDQVAQRLSDRFQVNVDPRAIGDSEAMLSLLSRRENTQSLAESVLAAISSRPDVSLKRPIDRQMIAEVAETLRQGRGFDRLVASWFVEPAKSDAKLENESDEGQDPAVVPAIGELLRPAGQHEAIVSTAALLLGSDMRCVRCHDLPTSGPDAVGSQHEYWQFAASISPWMGWQSDAKTGWFYDTVDGRRHLAEANLREDWPQHLIGSRPLAEGLVGAMWEMVHGRPLTSTPYDLSGSANDSDLQRVRDDLTNDLIANDFNLLRTISLIMTDSIVGRSTPRAMTPSGLLTASGDQWAQAVTAVEAFAAAPPESMPSSRSDRMQLVLAELPDAGSVESSSALLAQPLTMSDLGFDKISGSKTLLPTEMPKPSPAMVAGLPARATIVMPAWMSKLPDFDSRLEHIANLAGLKEAPEEIKTLATQMRSADLDEALILQRIWWIIRPQN